MTIITKWVLSKTGHYLEVLPRERAIRYSLPVSQEPPPEEGVEAAEESFLQAACLEKGKWVPL